MMKLLFTGFEPFGRDVTNPSWDAVSLLPDTLGGAAVAKALLPVEYDKVRGLLDDLLKRERPDAVICVGQAGGRTALTPEYAAINLKDASIPDNAGISYDGQPIVPEGPAAYFTTLPVKAMAEAMRAAGVPAALSYSAGTYVCNSLMYHLLDLLHRDYPKTLGGFIHLPYDCTQILRHPSSPSLPLDFMAKGLAAAGEAAAKALRQGKGDIGGAAGYTH